MKESRIIISKKKIIWFILSILWALVIFSFSAKNSNESAKESRRVGKFICSIFVSGYDEMDENEQYELAGKIEYPIRKAAHMTEYAILGFLLMGLMENMIISFVVGAIYAATDEIHQYFVPGRSCQITDVLIDSFGVIIGIILFCVIKKLFTIMNHRKWRGYHQ